MMCLWVFLVPLIVMPFSVQGALIGAVGAGGNGANEQDIASPLRVAQCRATCLEKFSNEKSKKESCLQGPDCFMCWENCELLQSNYQTWGAMCEEEEICFPGCQQACKFHNESSLRTQQTQPVIHTKGEAVIHVNGARAEWPNRPATLQPDIPVVYVVMRKGQTGPWRQIIQTIDSSTRVPSSDQGKAMLRVLVVDPQGLITIYSPDEEESFKLNNNKKRKKTINTEINKVNNNNNNNNNNNENKSNAIGSGTDAPWTLKEVSLIHQKVLVIGEIAWEPKATKGVYLVTWEVDGGGLKGNLYTDSTCVTLSLWPNTIYHIQVELVSKVPGVENIKSQMMDLDTACAQKVSTETDVNIIQDDSEETTNRNSPLLSILMQNDDNNRYNDVDVKSESLENKRDLLETYFAMGTALVIVIFLIAVIWKNHERCVNHTYNPFVNEPRRMKLVDNLDTGFYPVVAVLHPTPTDVVPPSLTPDGTTTTTNYLPNNTNYTTEDI